MPHSSFHVQEPTTEAPPGQPRRLVLCFDGTGNQYLGTEEDTNIVKIFEMLETNTADQYSYYQPGIGTLTYVKGTTFQSGGISLWSKLKARAKGLLDEAVGNSFAEHVLAGYRFVMRYYSRGDHIYIFGFSRGAYTARFLAEMIHNIGLLARGNEEMVPFAWQTFSQYHSSRGNIPRKKRDHELARYMQKFKTTFCRPDVGVHFLGLFDCVNSVGQFEIPFFRRSYRYIASPAARHIRHAVSIHERRLKFKPALFHLDPKGPLVDFKEVWFAGNHGDIGGGWPLNPAQKHLLSDIPLRWMLYEVLNLPGSESKLSFVDHPNLQEILLRKTESLCKDEEHGSEAWVQQQKNNQPHDKLRFGYGGNGISVFLWWILEVLPIATRLELESGKWVPRRLPPNLGAERDIPHGATIHPSVYDMLDTGILDNFPIPKKGGDNPNLPPSIANRE